MAKKFWSSEKLLSFTAIFISILTLIVFLYQTNLIRKEQYISVLPYLELTNYGTNTHKYGLVLQNNGIGPAIITDLKVEFEGEKKYDSINAYLNDQLPKSDTVSYLYSSIYPGRLIPEKEIIELITVSKGDYYSSQRLHEILNREELLIEIGFESVYGEKWVVNNNDRFPVKQ